MVHGVILHPLFGIHAAFSLEWHCWAPMQLVEYGPTHHTIIWFSLNINQRHLISTNSILFSFQIEGHIFTVLNYCIFIVKFNIYYQWIHNNSVIDLFQYLIELKTKLKIDYICASNFSFYMKNWKILIKV